MTDHSTRAHALLSASGSGMWLACPPSARLNDGVEDEDSDAALTGTLGHEFTENLVLHYLERRSERDKNLRERELRKSKYYSDDLYDKVLLCFEYAKSRIDAAKEVDPDALILVEQRLDFSRWVPEGFGSGDLSILTVAYFESIDWKFGRVPVPIRGNTQLRLYLLGMFDNFGMIYTPPKGIMTIMQPFISDEPQTEEVERSDLYLWADLIKPVAQLAWAGKGEFNPGEKQCQWCKVRGACRARAEYMQDSATRDFAQPALLDDEELSELYQRITQVRSWCDDVDAAVIHKMTWHGNLPGLKLVDGRGYRVINDATKARDRLLRHGFALEDITAPEVPRTLLGITKLEQQIGKKVFADLLSDLTSRHVGMFEIVPVDDPRPPKEPTEKPTANEDFA